MCRDYNKILKTGLRCWSTPHGCAPEMETGEEATKSHPPQPTKTKQKRHAPPSQPYASIICVREQRPLFRKVLCHDQWCSRWKNTPAATLTSRKTVVTYYAPTSRGGRQETRSTKQRKTRFHQCGTEPSGMIAHSASRPYPNPPVAAVVVLEGLVHAEAGRGRGGLVRDPLHRGRHPACNGGGGAG